MALSVHYFVSASPTGGGTVWKRGNVESDLRSLKQTVRLHRLAVQSVDLMKKELMVAVVAYNLVRAILCLAARQSGFIHDNSVLPERTTSSRTASGLC
jgi:hypothetical protein